MSVSTLVERAARSEGCVVHPASGSPIVRSGLVVPQDVATFYELCGGVDLYPDADYGISIVAAADFQPANVVILGEQFDDDPSAAWYIIARTVDREYLSVDLSVERNGRCYDSFHEVHGVVGSAAVVANTFTDLFDHLLDSGGEHWYWLEPGFVTLGDAYD